MLSLTDALRINAARSPDKIALDTGALRRTYRELYERSERLAAALARLGVTTESRIGLYVGNRVEHIEALLAIARVGAIAVPMDRRWSPKEVAEALTAFRCGLVVVEPAIEDRLQEAIRLSRTSPELLRTDDDFERLVAERNAAVPRATSDPARPYLIAPTGGTSGRIKGSLISYRATLMRFWAQAVEFGFRRDDHYLMATPLFHGGARSFALSHLYYGGSVRLMERFDEEEFVRVANEQQATTTFLVPTTLDRLLALGERRSVAIPSLRVLISSGSALHPQTRAQVVERVTPNLYNYFASVDAGGHSVLHPWELATKGDTVGQPIWGSEIALVDPEGNPVPVGSEGLVAARGPAVSDGYDANPEATAASFRNGWFITGDLARFDADGYLVVAGRATDMIITGGINVYPDEVEQVLTSHPEIERACVVGVPDPQWGEAVIAAVVRRPGSELTDAELIHFAARYLAGYKKPKRIVFVDELPLSSMGKVSRAQVRAMLEDTP